MWIKEVAADGRESASQKLDNENFVVQKMKMHEK